MDSAAALAQLQGFQGQAQNPNQYLANQRQQLGVNAAQDTVKGLRGAINNTTKLLQQVAPSVMGRTASSLVTSAQANKQVQNEQQPIAQSLENQGREYNQSSQDANELERQAAQAASGEYQGQQDRLSYMQNLYNTLYQKEEAARAAAEERRQFDAQMAELRAGRAASGSAGGGFSLSGGAAPTAAGPQNPLDREKEAAYVDVQRFLAQGRDAARSDYNATAKSAARGNVKDQFKLNFYAQSGLLR
jgi:hypothetical protein